MLLLEINLTKKIRNLQSKCIRSIFKIQPLHLNNRIETCLAADKQEQSEVMIAIQWFFLQEENIYRLNKNIQSVKKLYDLILGGIKRLLNSCLIYIKTDSFICMYILQITTSLSKVIFNFHLMNDQRFMKLEDQKQFLEICEELKLQIEIEKNDLVQNQIELFLFLTQIAIEIAPNNSNEKKDILTGCLEGIISSVIKMSPDQKLLDTLFQGAKLLYQEYNNNKKKKQYEVYYQIDMLQWEIILYFKNNQSKSLEQIIYQIEAMYEMIVKGSVNWIDHYLWVQVIGKILIYNPLLTKKRLDQVVNSLNLRDQLISQIWKDYKTKGILIQLNFTNDTAVIVLNQLKNKKTLDTDRLILEFCFQGWENLLLLQEQLIQDQYGMVSFTFRAYLKSKLDLENNNDEVDIATDEIQKFLSFILSNKLFTLIKQNFQKLNDVIQIWKSLEMDSLISLKISQGSLKTQIKNIIKNLEEFHQNIQHIMKIFLLYLQKNEQLTDRCVQKELIDYEEFTYLLRLLKQTLQQFIKQLKAEILQQQNQLVQKSGEGDSGDDKMLFNQIVLIKTELQNFNLNDKNFQLLNDLLSELLKNPNIQGKKFITEAQKIITKIYQLQEQIDKLNVAQFQKYGVVQCFMNLLQKYYCYFEKQNAEIQKDFTNTLKEMRELYIRYHQINSSKTIEELNKIKQELNNQQFRKFIENSRFYFSKLYLHLISFKEAFQRMQIFAKPEELQKLKLVINFNQFLFEAIKKIPIRMSICDINFQDTLTEIKGLGAVTLELFKNQLQEQKGITQYHLLKFQLEAQKIDQEIIDLELFKKEFGVIFTGKSNNNQMIDCISQILQNVNIDNSIKIVTDENFNEDQLKIEQTIYENLLNELKKIKGCQKIDEVQQLINQTQIVVETFKNSNKIHIQISKILFDQKLIDLQNQIDYLENYINLNSLENPNQEIKNINQYLVNLNFFIQFLKIQRTRIDKLKQILDDILLDFEKLQNTKEIIEQQEIGVQSKMLQSFSRYIYKKINSFEKLQWIKINQQSQDKENTQINFESILAGLQKEIDESQKYNTTKGELFKKSQSEQNEKIRNDQNMITESQQKKAAYSDKKEVNKNEQKEAIDIEEDRAINNQQQTNFFDYFNKLKIFMKEELIRQQNQQDEVKLDQEFIIIQIKKLYFGEIEEELEMGIEEDEEHSNQEKGFFQRYHQKYIDFQNNEQWKIKQGLVFMIIQISANCFSSQIISFCQTALVQLWGKEKDQRIRNLLKNQNLMSMQMQLLQKDWKTQHDRIEGEMRFMLEKIDNLQDQISHEVNLNTRDEQLVELDETTQQLDEYISNISEMGQQLKLITDFLKHMRKGLTRLEGKINDMKHQLNSIGNDVKFLRGKSVTQLLEIRKWKVLKEAASKNVKSIYIPLKTKEKTVQGDWKPESNLMNLERFDDKEGEVNEFLLDEDTTKQTVLLIHGIAGSGKSTAAKKIEEFLWKLHDNNKKFNNLVLMPIYISLPSLKNPVFQAVEEALHQVEYGFDELQLKECKDMLEKKQHRFVLIFDGYDEMNLENIQKNLYRSNKLLQNWYNPLVIFTTRSEIFSTQNYKEWFEPENKDQLKEVQLLKFDQQQMEQYLQKFTLLSIKVLIYETYEWSNQIQNQKQLDQKKFEIAWEKLEKQFCNQIQSNIKSESLLNEKQIENILEFLKNDQWIALKNNEAARSLEINLQKLWSVDKYQNIMKMVNIDKLVETPYLMEIIVQVLPSMLAKATEIANLKQNFIKNFAIMIKNTFKSTFLINMYNQQKKNLREQNHETENETSLIIQKMEKFDYSQPALQIWSIMEQYQILIRFQLDQEFKELKTKLLSIFEDGELQKLILQGKLIVKFSIENYIIVELICNALKEQNLTSFDFYDEFIRQYYLKQIEKQRNLGKSINIDRFLHDLQKFSINLAKKMSNKQITQLQYKQQGLLYKEKNEEEWSEFFNDDGQEGQYKKDIRSCALIQQKGSTIQFVHKSIQEFLIAADLYNLLMQSRDFDLLVFKITMEMLIKKDQTQDYLKLIYLDDITKYTYANFQFNGLQLYEKQQKLDQLSNKIDKLISIIKEIQAHYFNKVNFSTEIYIETRQYLIKKFHKILIQQNYQNFQFD